MKDDLTLMTCRACLRTSDFELELLKSSMKNFNISLKSEHIVLSSLNIKKNENENLIPEPLTADTEFISIVDMIMYDDDTFSSKRRHVSTKLFF